MIKKETNKSKYETLGLQPIYNEDYYAMQGFFEKAQEICVYYGFKPLACSPLYQESVLSNSLQEHYDTESKKVLSLKKNNHSLITSYPHIAQIIQDLALVALRPTKIQTELTYTFSPCATFSKKTGEFEIDWKFTIAAVGNAKPISEAMLIQTALAILQEHGMNDVLIDVFTLGDEDSQSDYVKELRSYYRKHSSKFTAEEKELLKSQTIKLLELKETKFKSINSEAPDSVNFLSPNSKKHFKKLLESIEHMDLPYSINNEVIHCVGPYHNETIYSIKEINKDDESVSFLACGGFTSTLGKRLDIAKELPCASITISYNAIKKSKQFQSIAPKIQKSANVFFVQIGELASISSLSILEILRKNKIPVHHALSDDSITTQIDKAKALNIPYMVIYGQREVLDKTVIVRTVKSNSQENVKIEKLAEYLKKLK